MTQADQDAFSSQKEGHSIFTYYLLKGLKGDAKSVNTEGHVSVSSLGDYVYEELSSLPANERPLQKPLMKSTGGKDIILAYYPKLAKYPELEISPELQTVASLINKGNEYYADEEYIEALRYYAAALEINPDSSSLWARKARAAHNMGDYKEALYCCKRALDLDSSDKKTKSLYNLIYEKLKTDTKETVQADTHILRLRKYYTTSHAIIIGIRDYKDENSLPNAYNDAVCMENILKGKYDFSDVITLYNENATKQKIEEVLVDDLCDQNRIGPKDRVLVYYSGHGKLRSDVDYEGKNRQQGYIIPQDAKKGKYSSYLEMETIIKACQNCYAKHTLLILDCCYSGYAALRGTRSEEPQKVTDRYLDSIASYRTIQVLAAGEQDAPVNDSGIRRGNSAFTGALLDILESQKDLDSDGILTAREIGSKLSKEVARHTTGTPQRPVFSDISGSQFGEFIFRIFSV